MLNLSMLNRSMITVARSGKQGREPLSGA